jgi:hypothetical protein
MRVEQCHCLAWLHCTRIIGLHVGVKEFLKIGVAKIADEIPVKLIDRETSL